ncbi:NAC-domain-containing protein [Calocera cornea HHB12733]|uniref:Nascent polypeptide-associated complex subunit beta n=1 Tax=Calocera cornea HHB12733 TaxID=1353952 RepID=A0A165CWC3_9BASI|nr:NAC-domain-containing protein [Calocera cornea HHB12733]
MDPSKLAKLQAAAASNRIGGKGTVRRKVVRKPAKNSAQDDKKLQGALKKLAVQPIAGVEEVNMFKEDGNVLHFSAPTGASGPTYMRAGSTVHAAVPANTFAIYGVGQTKELTELVPGILNQLGPDSLASLRKLAESYQQIQAQQAAGAKDKGADEDEDDVPDLVENFDVEEGGDKGKLEELE